MEILFLGEDSGSSAEYLRQSLVYLGNRVTHVSCSQDFDLAVDSFDLIVISDYPASKIDDQHAKDIIDLVKSGKKFVMLGGWISFNGKGSSYYNHPLSSILPVVMQMEDDRINYFQGVTVCPGDYIKNKYSLKSDKLPVICGYNQVAVKEKAQVLFEMKKIETDGENIRLMKAAPLVVQQKVGQGYVCACLTDVAPHWCGGLVDWGEKRIKLETVELGDQFINFINILFSPGDI